MARKAKQLITKINDKTGKYEKLTVKAPKGQRRAGVNQDGKIILYDDKGTVIAFRE